MTRNTLPASLIFLLAALSLAGCQPADEEGANDVLTDAVDNEPRPADAADDEGARADAATETARSSPGKPTAPIDIDYQVIGTPVVGQPVSVNLQVSSSLADTPVTLNYRINDATTLTFAESQVERIALGAIGDVQPARQQVTVVPQRQGRLYLNVAAEVETDGGTLVKSMAIPIQVGSTPAGRRSNGELQQDANGEPVISLPADDN